MWKGRQNVKNITYLHLYIHDGYEINYITWDEEIQKRTSRIIIWFTVGVNGFYDNWLQDLLLVMSVLLDKVQWIAEREKLGVEEEENICPKMDQTVEPILSFLSRPDVDDDGADDMD